MHVRFPQHEPVPSMRNDFDSNLRFCARAPSHKLVPMVIKGLFGGLENYDSAAYPRRHEVLARPVGMDPFTLSRSCIGTKPPLQPIAYCGFGHGELCAPWLTPELSQPHGIVIDLPESLVLCIFYDPSVQDRKEIDFLPLRFEKSDHFKSDSGAFAHPS